MRRRTLILTIFAFSVGGLGSAVSCNDRAAGSDASDDECYPPDPEIPWEPGDYIPFCHWGSREEEPVPPEDMYAYAVGECVKLPWGSDCTPCDTETIESLLLQKIATECDEPVDELIPGCWWTTEYPSLDSYQCCYGAYYISACEHQ